jgi:hypothetical protein
MAGWVAAVACALLVMTLFESISQVRSIEVREGIEEFLSTPPGNGLGLTVAGAIEILRALMLFTGAVAAAATVLAIYVLQRHQAARIGFTIAAGTIMLMAPVSGGFLPVMIAFSAIMLWTRPARDWFAGSTSSQPSKNQRGVAMSEKSSEDRRPSEDGRGGQDNAPEWPRMPNSNSPSERPAPPPTEGFGTPAPPSQPQQGGYPGQSGYPGQGQPEQHGQGQPGYPAPPSPYAQGGSPSASWAPPAYGQYPQQAPSYSAYGHPDDPGRRPATVTIAAWLTWGAAGLTLFVYGIVVLLLLVAQDRLIDALEQQPGFQELNMARDQVLALLWLMSAVIIVWCLAAIVLAFFAYRRANWARITLVASAAMALLLSLAAFPLGLLHVLLTGAVIALLFLGGANAWYSHKDSGGGFPYYPSGPQQYGQSPYGQSPYGQPPYGGQQGQPPYGGQQGQQHGGQPGQPPREDEKDPPKNVW